MYRVKSNARYLFTWWTSPSRMASMVFGSSILSSPIVLFPIFWKHRLNSLEGNIGIIRRIYFLNITLRKFPVVLPHELLPLLYERHHVPHPDADGGATSEFWHHMCQLSLPWTESVTSTLNDGQILPLYLWGDDAQINERGEKLIAVARGSWLDERSNGKDSVWPLFSIRSESWLP